MTSANFFSPSNRVLIAFLATLGAFIASKFAGLGDTETTVLSGVLGFLSRDLIPERKTVK